MSNKIIATPIRSIPELVAKLNQHEKMRIETLMGCTNAEIQNLMKAQNVTYFPQLYVDFMRFFGKSLHSRVFLNSEDTRYDDILEILEPFTESAQEEGWLLPEKAFIFWTHNYHQYWYFHTEQGDNPTIFMFNTGEKDSIESFESFSHLLGWWYEYFKWGLRFK